MRLANLQRSRCNDVAQNNIRCIVQTNRITSKIADQLTVARIDGSTTGVDYDESVVNINDGINNDTRATVKNNVAVDVATGGIDVRIDRNVFGGRVEVACYGA